MGSPTPALGSIVEDREERSISGREYGEDALAPVQRGGGTRDRENDDDEDDGMDFFQMLASDPANPPPPQPASLNPT